jgi:hypothetical protein
LYPIHDLSDQWQWITILDGDRIKASKIDTQR